eukprot:s2963_g9.t2
MLQVSRLTLSCFPDEELTVAGMDSFVEGSLDVRGAGPTLTSTAAFSNLRFSAKIQAQLESVSRDSLKQAEPLLEHFEISIGLGNVSAESDILAMVSQKALGALEVDQFQKLECLVACARGAAVGPEAPVALRRLRIDNMMIPVARMGNSTWICSGDSAHPPVLDDHPARRFERHGAANAGECVVNISLLLTSLVLAVIGVVAWVYAERSDQGQFFNKSSLAACQAIPRGLSLGYPFFLVSTMFLFLFSDLGLGTVINVIFQAGSEHMKIGPAFSFSVLTLSRDSLRGGAWLLALLIVGLSGVWPFVKLALLLHVWLAPTTRPRRTKVLLFLDEYGKYSLVDSWLAILALCAFDIKWFGEEKGSVEVSVQVTPVPMLPFFTFVIATVLSLVLGHIATESNRRSLQETAPPLRSSSRNISGNISESELVHKSYDLCRELPRGRAVLLLALTFLTGISIVCSASLQSLEYKVSGAISDLLLKVEERDLKYSLVGLGMFLTTGFQESGGLHAVQAIFFSFTLDRLLVPKVIPLLLVCAVLALLLVPMTKAQHGLLWKVCHVLDAWAAFDVFVLAVTVANFEFWIFSNFLIYHDNIAAACGWVHDNLELECLAMECHVLPGFAVLAAAGIGSYAVPKMVLLSCEDLLDQAQAESESEEASGLLSEVQLFAEPPRSFAFDGVLRESATQTEVFQLFGTGVAEFCLSGYNGSIYVYGQTGSGKTHTMQGEVESVQSMHNGEQRGLMCRILDYIFSEIGRRNQTGGTIQHSCKCSYLEIYKEQITDLLEPSSTNLQIREDINHGVYVERLSEHSVWSASDAFHVVWKGLHQRHVASTQMNELSSRSHSVFTLKVEASSTTAGGITSTKIARLNLIDLAGSERQTFDPHNPSAHESIRVKEAGAINRSLSALTNVIMSLSHGRRKVSAAGQRQPFVRYRDSKLTFLLRDSLGGNSKTVIVACISPAAMCFGETLSTLKFASRAKHIRCAAVMNEEYSGTVESLVLEVKSLRQQLDLLSSRGLAMEASDLKTRSSPSSRPRDAQKLGREEASVEAALAEALQAGGSEDLRGLYGPRRIRRLEILLAAALDRERRCELRRHKVDKDGVTDSCAAAVVVFVLQNDLVKEAAEIACGQSSTSRSRPRQTWKAGYRSNCPRPRNLLPPSQRARPTHFVAIHLKSREIQRCVEQLQQWFVAQDKLFERCLVPIRRLHTALLLTSFEEPRVSEARQVCAEAARSIREFLGGEAVQLKAEGIGSFGGRVVFARVRTEPPELLQEMRHLLCRSRCIRFVRALTATGGWGLLVKGGLTERQMDPELLAPGHRRARHSGAIDDWSCPGIGGWRHWWLGLLARKATRATLAQSRRAWRRPFANSPRAAAPAPAPAAPAPVSPYLRSGTSTPAPADYFIPAGTEAKAASLEASRANAATWEVAALTSMPASGTSTPARRRRRGDRGTRSAVTGVRQFFRLSAEPRTPAMPEVLSGSGRRLDAGGGFFRRGLILVLIRLDVGQRVTDRRQLCEKAGGELSSSAVSAAELALSTLPT